VLFEDHAITGAQDVTVVWVEPGATHAETALEIDRDEVWFRRFPISTRPRLGTLSGHVLGAGTATKIQIEADGATVAGSGTAQADGTFSVALEGSAQGMFDLATNAQDGQGMLLGAGLVRGLMSAATVNADVTIDHVADQQRTITVRGADAYGSMNPTYYVDHYLDGHYLFSSSSTSPAPTATLPTIDTTGTFAGVKRDAIVLAGAYNPGLAVVSMPLDSSSITLDMLAPPVVASPTLESSTPTTPVALAGLDFTLTPAPSTQYTTLAIFQDAGSGNTVDWDVWMPSVPTDFALFPLPVDSAPNALQPGVMSVNVGSYFDDHYPSYADIWTSAPFAPDFSKDTYREADVLGFLLLQ
jgi:hypothetical protein